MAIVKKLSQKDLDQIGNLLAGYGPGILCRDPGGNLAYFAFQGGPSHWMPVFEEVNGQRVRVFFLRGSPWRPSPSNGWEVLWERP